MKRKAIKIVSILLCVCVAVVLFFTMTRVADISVNVSESATLDPSEIEKTLSVYLNKNIFGVNKVEMISTLRANHPNVKVVAGENGIVKSFPNQITVQVTERNPLFAVKTDEGYDVIDYEGVFIGRRAAGEIDLPVAICKLTEGNELGMPYAGTKEYDAIYTAFYETYLCSSADLTLADVLDNALIDMEKRLLIRTKTGVTIILDDYSEKTREKMQNALTAYLNYSSDTEKLSGYLLAYSVEDQIKTVYKKELV